MTYLLINIPWISSRRRIKKSEGKISSGVHLSNSFHVINCISSVSFKFRCHCVLCNQTPSTLEPHSISQMMTSTAVMMQDN